MHTISWPKSVPRAQVDSTHASVCCRPPDTPSRKLSVAKIKSWARATTTTRRLSGALCSANVDRTRFVLALIPMICWPPAMLLWFAIHPFARFWRRFGAGWTYAILAVPSLLLGALLWRWRYRLLSVDFGTSYPLIALAVVAAIGALILSAKRRKYLTFRILAGVPELSRGDDRGVLLREGIYGVIRNPRYIEALLGVAAYTLFSNYLGVYVLWVLSLPAIYLVVVLEERELRDRFGAEYESYCREVPRFMPRSWRSVLPSGES